MLLTKTQHTIPSTLKSVWDPYLERARLQLLQVSLAVVLAQSCSLVCLAQRWLWGCPGKWSAGPQACLGLLWPRSVQECQRLATPLALQQLWSQQVCSSRAPLLQWWHQAC